MVALFVENKMIQRQTWPRKHFSHEETKYISLELLPSLCHLIRVMETSFLMLNLLPLLTSSVFFSQRGGALTINCSPTDELVMRPTVARDWHTHSRLNGKLWKWHCFFFCCWGTFVNSTSEQALRRWSQNIRELCWHWAGSEHRLCFLL